VDQGRLDGHRKAAREDASMLANVSGVGEDAPVDFEAAGLLDGLEGSEREQREKLLTRLADDGFSLDDLTRAVQENRLALLPVDEVLGGAYSAEEIEERTDLPAGMMVRIRGLHGLPTPGPRDNVFSEEDIAAARSTKLFLDAGFSEERIIEITRVLGDGDALGSQELTVCFADLVGFTRLGGQVEVLELGSLAGRLAELAASVTEAPVRLIKTIGDAAMFVSPEPAPLVKVALDLVAAFEREELPSLRAGIACGPALVRTGDYYGNSVNLASRVTGVAHPGSVLCTREVHDAAADRFQWSTAGRFRLKGVAGQTRLFRAR
jgi:class 3 adenylate cyclase